MYVIFGFPFLRPHRITEVPYLDLLRLSAVASRHHWRSNFFVLPVGDDMPSWRFDDIDQEVAVWLEASSIRNLQLRDLLNRDMRKHTSLPIDGVVDEYLSRRKHDLDLSVFAFEGILHQSKPIK
jgi:hypothetical protein